MVLYPALSFKDEYLDDINININIDIDG